MRIGRAPLGVEVIALVLRLPVKRCIGTTTADQKLADSSASPNCGAPTAGSGRHTRNRTSATACFRRRTPAEPQHVPVRSTGTGPPPAPSLAVEVVSPCLALESRTDTALQSRLDLLCPREPWKAQRPSPADQLPENCTLGVRMQSAIAHAVVRDPASDGQGSRPQPPQPHPLAPRPSPLARGTPRRRGRSRCRRGSATPAGPPGRKRQGSHATSAPADGVRTLTPQNGHQLPELLWTQPAEQGHPRRRPHPTPPLHILADDLGRSLRPAGAIGTAPACPSAP